MEQRILKLIKNIGFIFMTVSTIMFYNHLLTAARNPGFFVTVYFDMLGEGRFELLVFSMAIPFIIFAILVEEYQMFKESRER